jgi:hypothetical protein
MLSSGVLYAQIANSLKYEVEILIHRIQGLELDEADKNPFANTDGFYPV